MLWTPECDTTICIYVAEVFIYMLSIALIILAIQGRLCISISVVELCVGCTNISCFVTHWAWGRYLHPPSAISCIYSSFCMCLKCNTTSKPVMSYEGRLAALNDYLLNTDFLCVTQGVVAYWTCDTSARWPQQKPDQWPPPQCRAALYSMSWQFNFNFDFDFVTTVFACAKTCRAVDLVDFVCFQQVTTSNPDVNAISDQSSL